MQRDKESVLKGLTYVLNEYRNSIGADITNLNGTSWIREEMVEAETISREAILEVLLNIYIKLKKESKTNPIKFA